MNLVFAEIGASFDTAMLHAVALEVDPDFWTARYVKFLPVLMRPAARLPFQNTRHRVSVDLTFDVGVGQYRTGSSG